MHPMSAPAPPGARAATGHPAAPACEPRPRQPKTGTSERGAAFGRPNPPVRAVRRRCPGRTVTAGHAAAGGSPAPRQGRCARRLGPRSTSRLAPRVLASARAARARWPPSAAGARSPRRGPGARSPRLVPGPDPAVRRPPGNRGRGRTPGPGRRDRRTHGRSPGQGRPGRTGVRDPGSDGRSKIRLLSTSMPKILPLPGPGRAFVWLQAREMAPPAD